MWANGESSFFAFQAEHEAWQKAHHEPPLERTAFFPKLKVAAAADALEGAPVGGALGGREQAEFPLPGGRRSPRSPRRTPRTRELPAPPPRTRTGRHRAPPCAARGSFSLNRATPPLYLQKRRTRCAARGNHRRHRESHASAPGTRARAREPRTPARIPRQCPRQRCVRVRPRRKGARATTILEEARRRLRGCLRNSAGTAAEQSGRSQ